MSENIVSDLDIVNEIKSNISTKIEAVNSSKIIDIANSTMPVINKISSDSSLYSNLISEISSKIDKGTSFLYKVAFEFDEIDKKSKEVLDN